jgi:hypothetical protein
LDGFARLEPRRGAEEENFVLRRRFMPVTREASEMFFTLPLPLPQVFASSVVF